MDSNQIKQRTKGFAIAVIRMIEQLPHSKAADVIGKQLIRCGTSVGANYRAACRAKSSADFIHKMGIVEEETDEAIYWLEILVDTGLLKKEEYLRLSDEANQILSIVIASIRTARANKESASREKLAAPRCTSQGESR